MDSTATRLSKLTDYSKICLTTLEKAGLTLALLKPLIEDRELRAKHIQADAFIAHQHLATILLGSFLTEVFSISEGKGRQQASLQNIRSAIETQQDVHQKLEAMWSHSSITQWEDPEGVEGVLCEMALARLRQRDILKNRDRFGELRKSLMKDHDELLASDLYKNSKSVRDKILAHKDTWLCNQSNTYQPEWFDRFGLEYSHAWRLYERLTKLCKEYYLLLTRINYALEFLDKQSESIAMRFWQHE